MKKRVAVEENVIQVNTTYARTHQGIVVTCMIDTDFSEVLDIVDLSVLFKDFVKKQYGGIFKKYEFYSKFSTPMLLIVDDKLKLALCYATKDSDEVAEALQNINIPEEKGVSLK